MMVPKKSTIAVSICQPVKTKEDFSLLVVIS